MRNTRQKELVREIVNNSCEHLTAYQIYDISRKTIDNISLGTVYRILKELSENDRIIKISDKEINMDRYDNKKCRHNHFICDYCHKIIDIFEDVNFDIMKSDMFVINDYEIKYTGICSNCLGKEGKNNGIKK